MRRIRAEGAAADQAHARAVEQQQSAITERVRNDLQVQLADAHAAVDAYARRNAGLLRERAAAGAGEGGGGAADMSSAADAAGGADAEASYTVVPVGDLHICSDALTGLKGWQDWWREQAAVLR